MASHTVMLSDSECREVTAALELMIEHCNVMLANGPVDSFSARRQSASKNGQLHRSGLSAPHRAAEPGEFANFLAVSYAGCSPPAGGAATGSAGASIGSAETTGSCSGATSTAGLGVGSGVGSTLGVV